MTAAARFATGHRAHRPSVGADVERMGRLLGVRLLPWQTEVSTVAGEVLPSGRFAYPVVVLVVPRRAGKTVLSLVTLAHRAQLLERSSCWYTANRREAAAKQFRDEWVPLIEASPLAHKIRLRRSQGSEGLTFTATGSKVQLFPPTVSALHGTNADTVVIDEAWAFDQITGEDLEAGLRPAQATRSHRQTWIVSAGGTPTSTWLDHWVTVGRAATAADTGTGVAYFEWSADPEEPGYDPASPDLWSRTHPALGHQLDIEALRQDWLTMGRAMFERSYLNVWPRPSIAGSGLDLEAWADTADPDAVPTDPVTFAFDIAWDRSMAAVAAAGGTDPTVLEVVEHRHGVEWVAPMLRQLRDRHPDARFVADPLVCASILADLGPRFGVLELNAASVARSCVMVTDDVAAGRIAHRDQPALNTAVAGVLRRPLGDAFAWSRKTSPVDVSPLCAATFAAYAHRTRERVPKPALAVAR